MSLETNDPSSHAMEQEYHHPMSRLQSSPTDYQPNSISRVNTSNTINTTPHENKSSKMAGRQHFAFTDFVAARYLEDDPSVNILSRREILRGYEMFVVEQWVCSRVHPTFVITTYTGDPKDIVIVEVLSVPNDESEWSPMLRMYFKALEESHARRKETSLGTLMVTNLSGFPSSLTIIPVPEGDVKKHRVLFFVSENLKRLGCSGRLGIKLTEPNPAAQAKFLQLYRISDKIPLKSAVIELVKLCQAALVIFGKLEATYADGLLCDVTEKAINDWWVEFGAEYYAEPHDGILGPTTVAALLGLLMGARNRLGAYNAPVTKDVFDIEQTTKGIVHFQRVQRLPKTGVLDRQTFERLRRATAKAASKDSWTVPRAFKSTVAELGGKGGEMVMGMVGVGDKAGIADIETVDYERYIDLAYGERAKWLWYGKPRKSNTGDMFNRLPKEERSKSPDNHVRIAGHMMRESMLDENGITKRDSVDLGNASDGYAVPPEVLEREKDPYSKRAAIKRATTKIETGSGFSRIKDVVGRRNHQIKPSKDESLRIQLQQANIDNFVSKKNIDNEAYRLRTHIDRTEENGDTRRVDHGIEPNFTKVLTETPKDTPDVVFQNHFKVEDDDLQETAAIHEAASDNEGSQSPAIDNSVTESISHQGDRGARQSLDNDQIPLWLHHRTQSLNQLGSNQTTTVNDNRWPRHLSFSVAEDSILTWSSLVDAPAKGDDAVTFTLALASQKLLSSETMRLRHKLALIASLESLWVQGRLSDIIAGDAGAEADTMQLDSLYYPALETYQNLREDAQELVASQRAQLQESIRGLTELQDKLEYEIGGLRSRVDDLEDGVGDLERQVELVEENLNELEAELGGPREGWARWTLRMFTGIGRPPT